MDSSNRLYFMDNLRSLTIILVVALHTSLCYMAFAPEWWYVLDPERSLFFTAVVLVLDVFIMPVMFYISGYFLFASLRKHGTGRFLKGKSMRIALPWVVGVLVLAPPLAYMIYFSRQIPVSYLDFFTHDFWGKAYQQAHYWFIGVLMGFVLVTTALASAFPSLVKKPGQQKAPGPLFHVGFVALASLIFLGASLAFPLDSWIHPGYVFVFQPVRIGGLFLFFLLGIYCEQSGWFTPGGYEPKALPWGVLALISGALYLYMKLIFPEPKLTTLLLKATNAALFNIFCYTCIIWLLALCKTCFNQTGPLRKHFSDNSYGSYYVHQFFVFGVSYGLTKVQLPVFLKFSLTFTLAVTLSWATSSLMRSSAAMRRVF
ncbi:acyltransferase family protein [Desulfoluna spongiiphila]|uniref:Acyltransferase family protein n=1 Tax=Desulfoluna spongiiphila TaxID=419481 RepID=A0A1G5B3C1_9BACT|nr:acyltransferase family protein [Desulfoluna spongiiphila]SCX84678.1 Acyltransferase family protein [Desulfoluna spongiiphila]